MDNTQYRILVTKKDIINMIAGCSPTYDAMQFIPKAYGKFYDGGGFQWYKTELNKLTSEELWDFYQTIDQL